MRELGGTNGARSELAKRLNRAKRRAPRQVRPRAVEVLEDRQLLSTFTVKNLQNAGAGSFRQAILDANQHPGPDEIDFGVSGTIQVGLTSLPSIKQTVVIDGSKAPSFAGAPVVTVNFKNTKGLHFDKGADGSVLKSLSLVKARDAGVTLDAARVTVQGNYIGVLANGTTAAGNRGDGIKINASSHDNLIGRLDPVTSVSYFNASGISTTQAGFGWQGIRNGDSSGQYFIAGTLKPAGILYVGPITGNGGTSYAVNYPGASATSVYGPDNLGGGNVRLVGTYKNGDGVAHGFAFQGTLADLTAGSGGSYLTIDYPNATYNYVHSTMGGLAVGNADGPEGNAPIGTGHAFLYDLAAGHFRRDIVYPGSITTSVYGIWSNGGTSYTMVGGYDSGTPGGSVESNGFLVDYDSASDTYSHWTSFAYPNGVVGHDYVTHFEGVSSYEKGVYVIAADAIDRTSPAAPAQGATVSVRRNTDGTFGTPVWVNLNYPGYEGWTSNDSVATNQAVGIVIGKNTTTGQAAEFAYQATINTGFQLSNVISGNGGSGIGIHGSDNNRIAMNNIGTDASGTAAIGNAKDGIHITKGSVGNTIGGQATGGNNPTGGALPNSPPAVFVRPPQGNLISGNRGNGVLIDKGSTQTLLSGNFVGTAASGLSALANKKDGVAIENSDNNQLLGCTYQQDPFVFYNVISGNGDSGLRITDSNNTTVQANFLGTGANNASVVPNGHDGLLISGSSRNTQVGGVIPLGNVISGNGRNGIEVRDTASGFTSFNTFGGLYAFGGAAPNGRDGILITSSGGNNLIRTSIISGNLGNGIELGGNASGVQVTDTGVGRATYLAKAIPNGGDGIRISGFAHNNTIGGTQASIEPRVTVSANRGYGIHFSGFANNNIVQTTAIGSDNDLVAGLGNTLGGIALGPGTSNNIIGGTPSIQRNLILNNGGAGIILTFSNGNNVCGNEIRGNAKGGIVDIWGRKNVLGMGSASNGISSNGQDGIFLTGLVTGTQVVFSGINSNGVNGVVLDNALGATIGGVAGQGNVIQQRQGYALYAFGACYGSLVQSNFITGTVNVSKAKGLTYHPS